MKKLLSILLAIILIASLQACRSRQSKGLPENIGSKERPVKIGVVGENNEVWTFVKDKLEKEDVFIEIVSFTEYTQPNEALLSRDIDLNSFQHKHFLDNFNKEKKSKITSIGQTVLAPLGIYSKNIKDVSQLKKGDKVAIPNDVTNGSRSLVLLESAGLIKIDGKAGDVLTQSNIIENPLKLEIVELEASQTARALDDVAISCINNGHATDAGLNPTKDAIFLESVDENSKPFINIIASNKADADNNILKEIVRAYQEDDTKRAIDEYSKGSQIPAWEIK